MSCHMIERLYIRWDQSCFHDTPSHHMTVPIHHIVSCSILVCPFVYLHTLHVYLYTWFTFHQTKVLHAHLSGCMYMYAPKSFKTYLHWHLLYIHIHIVHTHIRLHALHVQAMSALLPALQGVLARMSQCKLHPAHICTLEQDIREGEQIDCSIQVCLSQVYLVDVQQLHRLSTRLKHAVQPPLLLATPASRIQPTPASDFSLLVAE